MQEKIMKSSKPFDSTVCFTFYGSWVNAIEEFEEDKETAYQLFKAIAYYSMYGEEPEFNCENNYITMALNSIWKVISQEIDQSVERRKRGFKQEEPTQKQQAIIKVCINSPNDSYRAIAERTGTSKTSVEKTKRKYKKEIEEGISKKQKQAAGETDMDYTRSVVTFEVDDDGELPF